MRYAGNRQIDRKENVVRLRSRTWYLDRLQEVPLRMVRRWRALSAERGALPLSEYVAMAETLTDLQLKGLPALIAEAGLPRDLLQVPPAHHILRLVAALSPCPAADALGRRRRAGRAHGSATQRQLFLNALQQIDADGHRALDVAQWRDGFLAASFGEPLERVIPRRSASRASEAADPPATRRAVGPRSRPPRSGGPAAGYDALLGATGEAAASVWAGRRGGRDIDGRDLDAGARSPATISRCVS